jgi:penicillin-binding protein 1C
MIAFKTGTSYGRRDAWSIGYTSRFTVGVWMGNVDNRGNADLVGSKAAAPLLFDILLSLSDGSEKRILRRPADVALRRVCAVSGRAPNPHCAHLIEELHSRSHSLRIPCTVCREILVSERGDVTYCPSCVGNRRIRTLTQEYHPPELVEFWKRNGVALRLPPPHNPFCTRVFEGGGPMILSPSEGMTYYLSPGDRTIVLRASSGLDVREHLWYIDERFVRRRRSGEGLFLTIGAGEHTITCVDDRGRSSRVTISVRIAG